MKRCIKCGDAGFADDANFCPRCAGRLEPVVTGRHAVVSSPEPSGPEERFSAGTRIGGNRTGAVYDAVDRQGGTPCVLKLVEPRTLATPQLLARAERDLKQLERLEHPGIAKVLASGRQGEGLWIACAPVPGISLQRRIAERGRLPVQRALRLLGQLAGALAEAAALGVSHRDLAPKNVLTTDADECVLINFPVAVPTTTAVPGVPEFLAPEQIEGKPVDQRANIYSLGALFHFMITGQPPYTGEADDVHKQHLTATPVPPSRHVPVAPEVDAFTLTALQRVSSKRFMNLRQLLLEIERLQDLEATTATELASGSPNGKGDTVSSKTLIGGFAAVKDLMEQAAKSGAGQGQPQGAAGGPPGMPPSDPGKDPEKGKPPSATSQPPAPAMATAPAPAAPAPAAAPPVQAHPPAAPAAAAPAPAGSGEVAQGAGGKGKKKPAAEPAAPAAKFRETMWFKKGELDEMAAEAAALAKKEDELSADKADLLPMEDRYKDDGSLSEADHQKFSLRTGATQMMPAYSVPRQAQSAVSEADLVDELKSGRVKIIAAIAGVFLVLVIGIYFVVSGGGHSGPAEETPATGTPAAAGTATAPAK